ncbi:peptidase M50 [Acidimicrobium ferrooxidans DSM 10331]|uniref:Peptidase M50 n=1 Tax=Acidimicrobium ferrooxidans (strain DSM 10331 / JCM 15462 / NBRC 103882 / ICP) TaxID=525909 RepID=C7LZA7_ACIFD|nr:site-2 protease family protein [Acidimicrobium ferrooxidans]ACU54065.1 peptidase M50 [Acidimicrobium ferrooxidans DSM 10331]
MTRERWLLAVVGAALVGLALWRGVINLTSLLYLAVLIPSVVLHELSHGWAALALGDDTAKRSGRLSWNPLRHLDPVGSVLVPVILIIAGLPPIGWAKPVPIDVRRLRHPRNGALIVGLVGPATNLVLAVALGIVAHAVIAHDIQTASAAQASSIGSSLVDQLLVEAGLVNLLLGVFNLIPLPPLDGGSILERVLPASAWYGFLRFRMGLLAVVVLVAVLFPSVLQLVFSPFEHWWISAFLTFSAPT